MITYSIGDMEMVTVDSTSNDCTYEARNPALQIIDNTLTFVDREKTCGLCNYTTSGTITFNNDDPASVMGTETSKCGGAPAATYDFTVTAEKETPHQQAKPAATA